MSKQSYFLNNKINILIPYILPILLILIWEGLVMFKIVPSTLIAPPTKVCLAFFELIQGKLLIHSLISLQRLFVGLLIGLAFALFIGIGVGYSKKIEGICGLTIDLLSPVPVIAWIPLLIIFFGISGAKLAVISFGSFFIIYSGVLNGIRSTKIEHLEIAIVHNKSSFEILKQVLLPSALPSIFQSIRLALAIGWILLLAGEMIASSSGLGWLIWDSRNFARSDDMIVGMISVGILGKSTDFFLKKIESKCLRWRHVFKGY